MNNLLEVRGLRVAYGTGERQREVVHGVDVSIAPGEFVAIVGESGSGKTTLAHAILRLLRGSGHITDGTVTLGETELTTLGERHLDRIRGQQVGLIPQDPGRGLNPVHRIIDQITEPLLLHRLANRRSAHRQALEMLERVGIPDPEIRARQYPHQLSGGMRQRVLIAAAMIAEPQLLIADEPTSALDVTVQKRVLDHLDVLVEQTGTAVAFITHDLAVAADRADRVLVMSQGHIVEEGPAAQVLHSPQHEYTQRLIAAAPSLSSARIVPRKPPEPAAELPPTVRVQNLVKEFRLPRRRMLRAVDGVSFDIAPGETFALVGESGSGKTTTARIVMALEQATTGLVQLGDAEVTGARGERLRGLRRRMQLVHQNPHTALDPRWEIGRIVTEPLAAFGIGTPAERLTWVREMLDRVSLPADVITRRPGELSGGQLQRVALMRALVLRPELVVLDEPVSALDVSVQEQILTLLTELQADLGVAYLFISHDLAVVRQIAHHVGVMHNGKLVDHGTVEAVFDSPRDDYTVELLKAIPGQGAPGR